MSTGRIIVQLHNTGSINQCKDFTKIALGMGVRDLVFSKASGSAATSGIPIAQKMAAAEGANIFYLKEISDSLDIIKPDVVHLFIRRPFSKDIFDAKTVIDAYKENKTILLIFGGSEPGLTKKELELGTAIYFDKVNEIGCLGELTLALYLLRQELDN